MGSYKELFIFRKLILDVFTPPSSWYKSQKCIFPGTNIAKSAVLNVQGDEKTRMVGYRAADPGDFFQGMKIILSVNPDPESLTEIPHAK